MRPTFRKLGETSSGRGYAREEMKLRSEIRKALKTQLVTLTGDPRASMRWTVSGFCKHVYLRHRLKLVGWPDKIWFTDLSNVTGRERISQLVDALRSGDLRFEAVSDDEYDAARADARCAAPSALHDGLSPTVSRNDVGRRRGRKKIDRDVFPERYERLGPKTPKVVSEEAEARAEGPVEEHELFRQGQAACTGPRPGQLRVLDQGLVVDIGLTYL